MNFLVTADEDVFSYFDVQNLSIDHSLITSEIEQYKDLIFSPNSLHQIYFKDSCDLETIELIKDLLSISEYVNDSKIDKFILLDLNGHEIDKLLSSIYEFPDTWQLPYELVDDSFSLTDIPHFRTLKAFINKLVDKYLSPLEQIMKIYDEIKLMDYENTDDINQLPFIISKKKTNSYGMNKLFSYILNQLGFKTYIGEIKSNESTYYVTLLEINDSKYNVKGIYLFDPSMDSLSKENYQKEDVRRINYNFFGISLAMLNRLSYDERLTGVLSLLSVDDLAYSTEKIEVSRSPKLLKEKDRILCAFGLNYQELFEKIKVTKPISLETIVACNDVLYHEKQERYNDILKENYETRKNELFEKNMEEELEEFIKAEKK